VAWDSVAERYLRWIPGQLGQLLADPDRAVRAYAEMLASALDSVTTIREARNAAIRDAMSGVRAFAFDVGETLVDETRAWSEWADWLGIPRLTFLAVCGAVVAGGGSDHRAPFRIFRPEFDLERETEDRRRAGMPDTILPGDLYPDAISTLEALRDAGYTLAVAGNQPADAMDALRRLELPVDLLAVSAEWGVHKPNPAFFARLAAELALEPHEVAYVGDRLDNDVRPAAAAGLVAVFIRRGPWAWIQSGDADPPEAALTITSLGELSAALAASEPPG